MILFQISTSIFHIFEQSSQNFVKDRSGEVRENKFLNHHSRDTVTRLKISCAIKLHRGTDLWLEISRFFDPVISIFETSLPSFKSTLKSISWSTIRYPFVGSFARMGINDIALDLKMCPFCHHDLSSNQHPLVLKPRLHVCVMSFIIEAVSVQKYRLKFKKDDVLLHNE